MTNPSIGSLGFYWRPDNIPAQNWDAKIRTWLKKKYPSVRIDTPTADDAIDCQVLVVLGGDGTILEAAKKYQKSNPIILGLNMGNVGFLAGIREEKSFLSGLEKLIKGNYRIVQRLMIRATVIRHKKEVFSTTALNEVFIQNPLGMVRIEVSIDGHAIQNIQGTGAMVSTPNGSTGYNISTHGPILMPDMECLILSEILDHNIPTPPIVLKSTSEIDMKVSDFRQRGLLSLTKNHQPVDVVLSADNAEIFPLAKNDTVLVRRSPNMVTFAEIEKNYFLKSLQEKFGFE